MSKNANYADNMAFISPFVLPTRKQYVCQITDASFWINDVKQADNTNKIEVENTAQDNWIEFNQANEQICTIYPVDGEKYGAFSKSPPKVSEPTRFILKTGKPAGGCDLLVLNDKWRFMEFKLNATSRSVLQIQENRDKAILQLARTVTFFKEQPNNTLTAQNTKCIVVVPDFYPEISKIDIAQAVDFLNDFGAPLSEISPNEMVVL
jgi:hypothetical protein